MTLSLGSIKLKNQLFLAPMVDVTDIAYRELCREQGAAMAYTEMINIGAILHENAKTLKMLKTSESDYPVGIQITGPTITEFKKVIPYLKDYDLVDINCGCPSIRIMDNASGSYLLKTPMKIAKYISILKSAGYTVTAKIRLGFKKNNVLAIAKAIEQAGADAITIHARMAHDSYKIPADWKWIKEVKSKLSIPVIGNGDIDSGKKAADMLKMADGCMIARAAIGNPHIFRNIIHYLKTGNEIQTTKEERIHAFKRYIELAEKYGVVELSRVKSLGGHFLSGFNDASKARAELMKGKSVKEILTSLESLNA